MQRELLRLGLFASTALASGCFGFNPLDLLGVESSVMERERKEPEPGLEDDRIEDKHPEYDPQRFVEEQFPGDCTIRLNKSATVTKLDIAPLEGDEEALAEAVFANRGEAAEAVRAVMDEKTTSLIPSMEVVNGVLKPFNDGLYAAVELNVQEGLEGLYPGKRPFLQELLASVLALREDATAAGRVHLGRAAVDLGAALILSGGAPELPADLQEAAAEAAAAFEADPIYSRPIGFYGWSKELGRIFRQDRFLQNYQGEPDPYSDAEIGKAAALALALDADPSLADRYEGYLALYAGLTNPFANHPVTVLSPFVADLASLDDPGGIREAFLAEHPPTSIFAVCQPTLALFPSSTSKETAYFESLYCGKGAPAGVNYMDVLIRAIREGLVELAPDAGSGWYDYQSHSLETLLLPERGSESQHLLLTKAYKEKLVNTFKSIITQNRETHVKQLDLGGSDSAVMDMPEIDLYPLFPVEPFPTFYLRSARAYRFLATYLEAVLGHGFLVRSGALDEDGGRSKTSLAEELAAKAELLYGLHLRTADAVGMAPELLLEELAEHPESACRQRAEEWLAGWEDDPAVLRDPRVIVPMQRDRDRREAIYWAVIGVEAIKASAAFVEGHEPRNIASSCWTGAIAPHNYFLLVEAFAEIRLPLDAPPPTREELRAACDAHDTVEDIAAALGGR